MAIKKQKLALDGQAVGEYWKIIDSQLDSTGPGPYKVQLKYALYKDKAAADRDAPPLELKLAEISITKLEFNNSNFLGLCYLKLKEWASHVFLDGHHIDDDIFDGEDV